MTGTAKTEEKEFVEIYGLNVVEIPTNVPVAREDQNDLIFKTKDAKFDAVVDDIAERHEEGQPVLVGTIDVETSEHLAQRLQRRGIPHNVLNAKQHEREAEIIKDAGQIGSVTIATNMAGRGVDIKLAEGVRELGGLYVLGTERHEARRIDNQLRGRSGRQGDPGESRYYLSGQDQVVRLFAGDRIYNIMERFKLPDDQPMEASILSKQIESAQKKVEEQNFVMRKNVLKYDDVLNTQRQVIYEQRRRVLEGDDLSGDVKGWIDEVVETLVAEYTAEEFVEEWDIAELVKATNDLFGTDMTEEEIREDLPELTREALVDDFAATAQEEYDDRTKAWGDEIARQVERYVILQVVDQRWREHLENMDYLREGVHLRAMAQKDPLVEYRHEGHLMFEELSRLIRSEVVSLLFHAEVTADQAAALEEEQRFEEDGDGYAYQHESLAGSDAIAAAGATGGAEPAVTAGAVGGGATAVATRQRVASEFDKVGRNDPCPCGSGKKFKKCHGA
jgi:preprotein translocase subunit SecA